MSLEKVLSVRDGRHTRLSRCRRMEASIPGWCCTLVCRVRLGELLAKSTSFIHHAVLFFSPADIKKKYECEFFLAGSELEVSGGEEPRTLRVGSRGLGDKAFGKLGKGAALMRTATD